MLIWFFFLRNPKSISTWNIKLILLKKSGNGRRKLLCGRRCKSSQRQTKRQLNHLQTLKQQSQKPKNNVAKEHENIYREAVLPAGGTCPREYYYKKRNLCVFFLLFSARSSLCFSKNKLKKLNKLEQKRTKASKASRAKMGY